MLHALSSLSVRDIIVSILTGPGGPVLPAPAPLTGATWMFQSSPGPEARCYSPQRRRGRANVAVSILTGPGGPVLPLSRLGIGA
mgnify:CR=1 FL=1